MDCSNKLQQTTFPDSTLAVELACSRTKAEVIINSVWAPHSIVIEFLNGISCFGLATDESNHGATKIFPILIQYFDPIKEGITTKIIELKSTPNETAETTDSDRLK